MRFPADLLSSLTLVSALQGGCSPDEDDQNLSLAEDTAPLIDDTPVLAEGPINTVEAYCDALRASVERGLWAETHFEAEVTAGAQGWFHHGAIVEFDPLFGANVKVDYAALDLPEPSQSGYTVKLVFSVRSAEDGELLAGSDQAVYTGFASAEGVFTQECLALYQTDPRELTMPLEAQLHVSGTDLSCPDIVLFEEDRPVTLTMPSAAVTRGGDIAGKIIEIDPEKAVVIGAETAFVRE